MEGHEFKHLFRDFDNSDFEREQSALFADLQSSPPVAATDVDLLDIKRIRKHYSGALRAAMLSVLTTRAPTPAADHPPSAVAGPSTPHPHLPHSQATKHVKTDDAVPHPSSTHSPASAAHVPPAAASAAHETASPSVSPASR